MLLSQSSDAADRSDLKFVDLNLSGEYRESMSSR